jgi:hypothetical protein
LADDTSSLSDLLSGMLDDAGRAAVSENQRASYLWSRANGDIERQHTTGVFVMESKIAGAPPVLGVYVDTRTRVVDFTANREVYLARLSAMGGCYSDIKFLLNKRKERIRSIVEHHPAETPEAELPPLSDAEEKDILGRVSALPESLRDDVFKAMALSYRREKKKSTGF